MPDTLSYDELLMGTGTLSRRSFFKIGAAAMAAAVLLSGATRLPKAMPALLTPGAAVGPAPLAEIADLAQAEMLSNTASLVRSLFAPYIGEMFRVGRGSAAEVALQLCQIRDLTATRRLIARGLAVDAEQNFSLQFRGPLDRPLMQDIYRFTHGPIGNFAVLLVPMRPEHDGRYYETLFNRLPEEPTR